MTYRTHNPYEESHWVSRLRENLTSGSDGKGLETGQLAPRQSFTRQIFFKWIKQHLHIKAFYGTSPNAVHCQIWIAICTYLLIAIAKKKLDLAISLYTFAQTLGLTLFEKTPIKELCNDKNLINNLSDENQLSLWDS
jgi:hypothetical protein